MYYNSVDISGNSTLDQNSYGFLFGDFSGNGLGDGIDLINNIFNNVRTGTGKHYAIGNIGAGASWNGGIVSNNNIFASTITQISIWDNTDCDLYDWQINSGADAYSVSSQSYFFDNSIADLHLVDNRNCANDGRGTPIAILVDYDNLGRDPNYPDVGADEFGVNTAMVLNDENYWTGITDQDWNKPSNWGCGLVPVNTSDIVIPQINTVSQFFPDITTTYSVQAQKLTVNYLAELTVSPVANLTLTGDFRNDGSFTLKSTSIGSASFIDNGTIVENGTTVVERWLSGCGCDYNYHYVGSPLENANFNYFPSNIYEYNEGNGSYFMNYGWNLKNAGTLTPAKGYNAKSPIEQTISFVSISGSKLNTGAVSIPLTYTNTKATSLYEGWNFVSNPYPSTVDWLSAGITKTNLDNTIYFWNGASYSYFIGAAGSNPSQTVLSWNYINDGTRYIPEMQGFLVKAKTGGGSITFTNAARLHNHGLYWGGFWKSDNSFQKDPFIKLKISSENLSDEAVIHFSDLCTDTVDSEYDAYKFITKKNGVLHLYSLSSDGVKLAINSVPALKAEKTIPLSYQCNITGNYTIQIQSFILPDSINIILEDLKTKKTHILNLEGAYTFEWTNNENENRFLLHFKTNKSIHPKIINNAETIKLFARNNKLIVQTNSKDEILLQLYSTTAQLLVSSKLVGNLNYEIPLNISTQIVFAKALQNNSITTQKIWFGNK